MSKMGISTIASYTGAQVFEAFGLAQPLVDEYFGGTPSRLGGVGLDVLADEAAARHARPTRWSRPRRAHRRLDVGGEYQWRREGELHLFNPETVFLLQHATRQRRYEVFREYTDKVEAAQPRGWHAARAVRVRAATGRRSRSTRSSRCQRDRASGSRPARCPTARSRPRRTRRSRSR